MSTSSDSWTSADHDPTSIVDQIADGPKLLTVRSVSGEVVVQYPDFAPDAPLRVLPAIVSSVCPAEGSVVDDGWSFVGATRHPEYATIRHDRDNVTIAMERDRLQPRPTS